MADETFDVFENASYLKGYLYKEVNVTTMLKRGGADPTLDELQRFVIDTQEMGPGDNEPSSVVKYPADDEQNVLSRHKSNCLLAVAELRIQRKKVLYLKRMIKYIIIVSRLILFWFFT